MGLIPPETRYSFRKGDKGIATWAIQKALDSLPGFGLDVDGHYGPNTEQAVAVFQENQQLLGDGIFGPASSAALALTVERRITVALPSGLLHGIIVSESGGHIGAVNWSAPGGVDCSYVQRRVLEADFDDKAVVHRAWNAPYQFNLSAKGFRAHRDTYVKRGNDNERSWRLALLYHNWPAAADTLSKGLPLANKIATWAGGATFADGAPVRSYLDWAKFYALGAPEHNHAGQTARFVTDWSV